VWLDGEAGNDVLHGGGGYNVLLRGAGADRLHSGGLLIGGTTAFDLPA
jgi:Ca2+-binding RTX toxin-like protein